jgi:hypothetical protein
MNIQNLLKSISSTGLTDMQIGEQINAPQSTVTRLRNGTHKSTNFERGTKIYELAKKLNVFAKEI